MEKSHNFADTIRATHALLDRLNTAITNAYEVFDRVPSSNIDQAAERMLEAAQRPFGPAASMVEMSKARLRESRELAATARTRLKTSAKQIEDAQARIAHGRTLRLPLLRGSPEVERARAARARSAENIRIAREGRETAERLIARAMALLDRHQRRSSPSCGGRWSAVQVRRVLRQHAPHAISNG